VFKYGEDEILNEIRYYIEGTYAQHYAVDTADSDKVQLIDIISDDELEAFAKISAMKYILRFGKKDGRNRKDLLKAVHYLVMMLRVDDMKRIKQ
jgi:hypothetical protein